MTYTIYGQRYQPYDPIIDPKSGEVIDDGQPKQIKLGSWSDKKLADGMAENVKKNCAKRSWKIWVE